MRNVAFSPDTHVTANIQVIDSVNAAVDTAVVPGTRFQFDTKKPSQVR